MAAPIACNLTPDQLRDRRASLLPGLAARARVVAPTDDGYRFEFSADEPAIVSTIATCIDAERHCCPFLRFALTVPAEAGSIHLELTGPDGTRAFLEALLGSQPTHSPTRI